MSGDAARATEARILNNVRLTPEIHSLLLRLPHVWGPARAGQFVQLQCPPLETFALRRPFSLAGYRVGESGVEIEIVYGAVGCRTRRLTECRPGESISVIGPLGRPFLPSPGRTPILIGGGRGIAPLLLLARQWKDEHPDGRLLYGAVNAAAMIPMKDAPYPVQTATDDGSRGFHGTAVDLLARLVERGEIPSKASALFACGPNRMLAAAARLASDHGIPCQASLETHFGCGIGICAGCAVPSNRRPGEADDPFSRYLLACTDGPVFESARVDWDGLVE
jgi:dihydroorotate dehydrogenase electron transfer subunit